MFYLLLNKGVYQGHTSIYSLGRCRTSALVLDFFKSYTSLNPKILQLTFLNAVRNTFASDASYR